MSSIYIPELDRKFASKDDAYKALKENESKLITAKRKSIVSDKIVTSSIEAVNTIKGLEDGYIYPIISVTNLYDSHRDVHFKGSMTKTVREQQGKVVYAIDHLLLVDKIIAWEDEVEMILMNLLMSDLGYAGDSREVETLVFKIKEDVVMNCGISAVTKIIAKRKPIQNSIRMVYYKLRLGINDPSDDYKENYEYYQSKINEIYNKEEVEEFGYFYGVEELGIKDEGSMVVKPSQKAAITLYPKDNNEPHQSTHDGESEPSTKTLTKSEIINLLKS